MVIKQHIDNTFRLNSTSTGHLGLWRIIDIGIGSLLGVVAALWIKPELVTDLIKSDKKERS